MVVFGCRHVERVHVLTFMPLLKYVFGGSDGKDTNRLYSFEFGECLNRSTNFANLGSLTVDLNWCLCASEQQMDMSHSEGRSAIAAIRTCCCTASRQNVSMLPLLLAPHWRSFVISSVLIWVALRYILGGCRKNNAYLDDFYSLDMGIASPSCDTLVDALMCAHCARVSSLMYLAEVRQCASRISLSFSSRSRWAGEMVARGVELLHLLC